MAGTMAAGTDADRERDALPVDTALVDAGHIIARLDRLPPTRTIWTLIVVLSRGFFFELYDLLFTGYVAPGLVKAGILTPTTPRLFGTAGIASFVASLFAGLFIGTAACGVLADRYGRRPIFTGSLLWYTAANLIMAMQSTARGLNFETSLRLPEPTTCRPSCRPRLR